ncbi:MAG: hypothetical protein EZS28_045785, partial [Streblomastix strix]
IRWINKYDGVRRLRYLLENPEISEQLRNTSDLFELRDLEETTYYNSGVLVPLPPLYEQIKIDQARLDATKKAQQSPDRQNTSNRLDGSGSVRGTQTNRPMSGSSRRTARPVSAYEKKRIIGQNQNASASNKQKKTADPQERSEHEHDDLGLGKKSSMIDRGNSKANKHTIILLQPVEDITSRTFLHFMSVGDALEGMVTLFEQV